MSNKKPEPKQLPADLPVNLNRARSEPSEKASASAKKSGLKHVGFGKYEDPKTNQISSVAQGDKLVPYNKAIKTNSYTQTNSDDIGNLSKDLMKDVQALHELLRSTYQASKYDNDELDAIYSYTDTAYASVNETLFGLPTGIIPDQIQMNSPDDQTVSIISSLDSAVKKCRAPQDFTVYTKIGKDHSIEEFKPGTSFKYKSFKSASINLNMVLDSDEDQFNEGVDSEVVLLQIKVKKNARGVYASEFSAHPEESEFILPRGSTIEIVSGPNKLVGSDATSGSQNMQILYFECSTKG